MNINPRKPLHSNRNTRNQLQEDSNEDIQENSQDTEEQTATESESDFYDEDDTNNYTHHWQYVRQASCEKSRSVPRTPEHSKGRPANRSPSVKPYIASSLNKPPKPIPQETKKNSSFLRILLVFIIAVVGVYSYSLSSPSVKYCSYEKLQKQYPQQKDELWQILKVGIELILNGSTHSPAVYLFVHQGGQHVLKLVKDIARHSSECFDPRMRPIEIESEDFLATNSEDRDYGYAIEKYRAKIKEGNVFLIVNLNEIPAEAARALHTICDTYSPIAENVVIFLTLTVPPIMEGTVVSNAENTLTDLWSAKLDRNELDPLITRVTDQVIALQN